MLVSVQTVVQSVQSLVGGLKQVNEEIQESRRAQPIPQDRFVVVMQVCAVHIDLHGVLLMMPQPFAVQMSAVVESLKNMATLLESDLRSLLAFYGETPDSPEAPKPEDFFGLILSFSSSLQKAALEVHNATPKVERPPTPKITIDEPSTPPAESVSMFRLGLHARVLTIRQTIKGSDAPAQSNNTLRASRSFGRGDLDQAIRSMRSGQRRERAPPSQTLGKLFIDSAR